MAMELVHIVYIPSDQGSVFFVAKQGNTFALQHALSGLLFAVQNLEAVLAATDEAELSISEQDKLEKELNSSTDVAHVLAKLLSSGLSFFKIETISQRLLQSDEAYAVTNADPLAVLSAAVDSALHHALATDGEGDGEVTRRLQEIVGSLERAESEAGAAARKAVWSQLQDHVLKKGSHTGPAVQALNSIASPGQSASR